ncbi:aromatic acid exporter family protein [Streptococcus cuniculipharyngis]|uniref:Aromatic acid exporter family protein n=1 Tax=Streptococcus cuniculipharyngis TaxID=1562651 RepID=A0A5C5SGG7_9STRE|nr:aromatic acid exporter family protein [Streptococcus cuniculipharyngis]TWS99001.1 aromatic acid exporter family protein [Streptococcus cuniculipharyngis]
MPIWQRTIKLALAFSLAIYFANQLGLSYASSAGIIALLNVMDTRRSSLKIANQRLLAVVLAFLIASILFAIFGYHLWVLGLYLISYVPLAHRWHLATGIAPSTVLVSHLYGETSIAWEWLTNELSLFLLGTGFALLVNAYMPSYQGQLDDYHQRVEESLRAILGRFSVFLDSGDGRNQAQMIDDLDRLLAQAQEVAILEERNQLFQQAHHYQLHYFSMRESQAQLLRQMAGQVNRCYQASQESRVLAQLFRQTAQELSQTNPAQGLLTEIEQRRDFFRQRALPQTRQEFETRALLFQLLNDLERFIQLKVNFYQHYQEEEGI